MRLLLSYLQSTVNKLESSYIESRYITRSSRITSSFVDPRQYWDNDDDDDDDLMPLGVFTKKDWTCMSVFYRKNKLSWQNLCFDYRFIIENYVIKTLRRIWSVCSRFVWNFWRIVWLPYSLLSVYHINLLTHASLVRITFWRKL